MKRKNKFSDWREDLIEVAGIPEQEPKTDTDSEKEITEKKIKNKITINPSMKEAFEEIGGTLLEVTELGEGKETEDSLKDRRMERGGVDGNNRYKKPISNTPNLFGKKKPKKGGSSAMDIVKKQITDKYGKGAIVDTKKKK